MARILVVDDSPTNIKILIEILGSEHTVLVATFGEQALLVATGDSPPDLILLDVNMPGMDGFEVCRQLKELDEKIRRIPVIFVTAMDEERDEEQGFKVGAVDYITKPYKPALLMARVRLHLRLALHQRLLSALVERAAGDLVLSPAELKMVGQLQHLQA